MAIDVRPAREGDLSSLVALNGAVQGLHHTKHPWLFKPHGDEDVLREFFAMLLADPAHRILLAQAGDAVAGYLSFETRQRPETALTYANTSLYIHHLAVGPEYRRCGVGRALMEAVNAAAREAAVSLIEVDFWSFNVEARAFYAAFGFNAYNERWWKRL